MKFITTLDQVSPQTESKAKEKGVIEVKLELKAMHATLKTLLHSTMLLYFTNRAPSIIFVKNWAKEEFQDMVGWQVDQVKLIDNNFFLIAFKKAKDRDTTLKAAPWFMYQRFFLTTT